MQGHWIHDAGYYRCRFPQEYANANNVGYPLNVYLREDDLRGPVDGWLAQAFAPSMIEQTSLDAAQPNNDSRLAELRRQIAECDRKLDGAAPSSKPGATPSSSQRGQGRAG